MDYFDLLHQAQMNNKSSSSGGSDIRCYKATFSAPKKVDKSRVSSDNIKKFLARKEEEEKRKLLEAKKKKEELLALRSLDKKAQKRVQVMLKRTKSANKSVMADAIDNYNTKDTLEGPKQCDEDDYGYVSQEASAFYEKLMAKYEKAPVENLKQMNREVKDLQAAKDRVKAALDKEAEEMLHPTRKRKRKHDDGEGPDDDKEEEESGKSEKIRDKYEPEKEPEKEKPKKISKKMPPPVDFFELMKIAAKKQHEPIMIEKKKVEEPERPMTKREKLQRQKELEREMERKNRKNNAKGQSEGRPSGEKQSSSKDDTSKSLLKSRLTSDVPESSKQKNIVKSKSDVNSNNTLPSFKKKEVKFSPSVETSPQPSKNNAISSVREKGSGGSDLKSKPLTNGHSKNSPSQGKVTSKLDNEEESPPKVDVSDIDKEIALLMKKKQMLMAKTEAAKTQKPPQKSNPATPQSSKDSMQRPSAPSGGNKPSSLPFKKSSTDGHNGMSPKVNDRDRLQARSLNDRDRLQAKGSNDRDRLQAKSSNDRDKLPVKNAMDKDRLQSKMANNHDRLPAKGSDLRPGANAPQRKFSPPRYGPPSREPPFMMKKKKPQNKRVIDSESEYDSEMDDFIDDGPDECMDYSSHIKEIFGYDKSRYSQIDEDECEESSFRTQMIEERRSAKIGLMEDLEDIQREKEEKARAKAKLMKKKMSMKR